MLLEVLNAVISITMTSFIAHGLWLCARWVRHLSKLGVARSWQVFLKIPLTQEIKDLRPLLREAERQRHEFDSPKFDFEPSSWRKSGDGVYTQNEFGCSLLLYRVSYGPNGPVLIIRPKALTLGILLVAAMFPDLTLLATTVLGLLFLLVLIVDITGVNGFLRLVLKERGYWPNRRMNSRRGRSKFMRVCPFGGEG